MSELDDLRDQLKAALKSRALVYSAVHEELSKELGATKSEEILKRAIYTRGASCSNRFSAHAPADFPGLRDSFLDFIPDHGKLFEPEVLRCDEQGLDIKFHACPLKEAWQEAALPEAQIETLCRIAGVVDNGTFEQAGFALRSETWKIGTEGCCGLSIRRKESVHG